MFPHVSHTDLTLEDRQLTVTETGLYGGTAWGHWSHRQTKPDAQAGKGVNRRESKASSHGCSPPLTHTASRTPLAAAARQLLALEEMMLKNK